MGSVSFSFQQLHASVRTSNLETCLRLLSLGADPNYVHPVRAWLIPPPSIFTDSFLHRSLLSPFPCTLPPSILPSLPPSVWPSIPPYFPSSLTLSSSLPSYPQSYPSPLGPSICPSVTPSLPPPGPRQHSPSCGGPRRPSDAGGTPLCLQRQPLHSGQTWPYT